MGKWQDRKTLDEGGRVSKTCCCTVWRSKAVHEGHGVKEVMGRQLRDSGTRCETHPRRGAWGQQAAKMS